MICSTCPATLGAKNKSGFCRSCLARRMNADPAVAARQKAGIRAKFADPAVRAAYAGRLGAYLQTMPEEDRERRREHGRRQYRERLSQPAARAKSRSPEVRAAAGRKRSATTLAWCPEAYRDQYRALLARNLVRAAEAKEMILAQVAADERRRLAAMTPFERQMEKVRNGARLVEKFTPRTADHAFTLGGVASGQL